MNLVQLIEQQMPEWFVNTGTKESPKLENLKKLILEVLAKKSSPDWLKHHNIPHTCILDPDGWDRKNYVESWNELITEEEFMTRVFKSTIMLRYPELIILREKYRTLLESKFKV